ncbi:MAG: hypothetical protein LWX83_13570 [Anaerolineae bacterium]|nr:hypothetical protein [Anaerolineae bacterium]
MSNQSFPNNPKTPPPAKGGANPQAAAGNSPKDSNDALEEQLKKLLSPVADNNPANIAEIIHMWLNEDKKQL